MTKFIPGHRLSKEFFERGVRPILDSRFPELEYSAGLIGSGSEVLGFDDEISADHHWGPRLMVFVNEKDYNENCQRIDTAMRERLPVRFLGYPTNFSDPDPNDNNVRRLVPVDNGPVSHRVEIFTLRSYLMSYLNFDIDREVEPADWLTFPEQKLRTISADGIFHDTIGVKSVLGRFSYYPRDVWLYVLAAGWNRIGQEEHLMGRAGQAGDQIGSALIASRLVRDIMRLCFLMERQYAPYPKWFGTAFRRLAVAKSIEPHLKAALMSANWQQREKNLVPAYEIIAQMHNRLNITEPLVTQAGLFFGRPFKVIDLTGGFSKAIASKIEDLAVKNIAAKGLIGSIDEMSDNTDLVSSSQWRSTLKKLYE